jgi:hypothetical protein
MQRLLVAAAYQPLLDRLGLRTARQVVQFFGANRCAAKRVWVQPKTLPLGQGRSVAVFYKQYDYARPTWHFWGRRSKARCEFDNYGALQALGVRCAERIACGEVRDWLGRLVRAFVLTKAVPNQGTLVEFVEKVCPTRATTEARALRRCLIRQLAEMTHRIHAASFFHHDLVWRNVLVEYDPLREPRLWWIDCPRGGFDCWSPLRRRRRLKDLASLDKLAMQHCTRAERLQFLKAYLLKERLDDRVKRLARATVAYGQKRWPEG